LSSFLLPIAYDEEGGRGLERRKKDKIRSVQKLQQTPQQQANGEITFPEFLRVNMRLAEDRILSFVSVFSTGYGTKWVPGKNICCWFAFLFLLFCPVSCTAVSLFSSFLCLSLVLQVLFFIINQKFNGIPY
jgi:hypothetical protein